MKVKSKENDDVRSYFKLEKFLFFLNFFFLYMRLFGSYLCDRDRNNESTGEEESDLKLSEWLRVSPLKKKKKLKSPE